MAKTYILRSFGSVLAVDIIVPVPSPPNTTCTVRSGAATLATRQGTAMLALRSGAARVVVRGA